MKKKKNKHPQNKTENRSALIVLNLQVLERQIRTRDDAAIETNFAVQTLDHKYIQGLGDLRGRVAR